MEIKEEKSIGAVIPKHYFTRNNHHDDDVSSVRVSIRSREKHASALDLTAEGDMNKDT